MDGLRLKMESEGLKDVTYMVVNQQGVQAQNLHPMLEQRLSANIALYKQEEQQPDVWQLLNGAKDDFFVYDRCGRLTHQISLPNSIIGQGHIEGAIKDAYCKRSCGACEYESVEIPSECQANVEERPAAPAVETDTGHHHHHHHPGHHGHGHHHHHHHHHHGNQDPVVVPHHSVDDHNAGQQANQDLHFQEAQSSSVMQVPLEPSKTK